jgi:hypothetical protein
MTGIFMDGAGSVSRAVLRTGGPSPSHSRQDQQQKHQGNPTPADSALVKPPAPIIASNPLNLS